MKAFLSYTLILINIISVCYISVFAVPALSSSEKRILKIMRSGDFDRIEQLVVDFQMIEGVFGALLLFLYTVIFFNTLFLFFTRKKL